MNETTRITDPDYLVIEAASANELERLVAHEIRTHGMTPLGGLTFHENLRPGQQAILYHQAMVKAPRAHKAQAE